MKTSSSKFDLKKTVRSLLFISYRTAFAIGSVVAPRIATEKGFRLFGTPMRPGKSRLAPESALPPPQIRKLPLTGAEVSAYVWGDPASQPVVLLLHGWNGWGLQLAGFVPALLDQGMAVVAVDHVGHGRSDGRFSALPVFIRTTRELLAAFPATKGIVAHSLGAAATAFVLAESGRSDLRTVLLAPPKHPRVFLEQFGAMLGMSRKVVDGIQRRIEETHGVTFADVDVEAVAPRIKAPVLLIHNPADDVVPFSHGQRYAQLIGDARFEAVDGIGHYKMTGSPEIIRMAAQFLFEGVDAGGQANASAPLHLIRGSRETVSV